MGSTDLSQSAQCKADCCCSVSWAASFDKSVKNERRNGMQEAGVGWEGTSLEPGETWELRMCCSGEL